MFTKRLFCWTCSDANTALTSLQILVNLVIMLIIYNRIRLTIRCSVIVITLTLCEKAFKDFSVWIQVFFLRSLHCRFGLYRWMTYWGYTIYLLFWQMASMAPTSDSRESGSHAVGVDSLPEEMNDMKIRDDKVCMLKSWKLCFF